MAKKQIKSSKSVKKTATQKQVLSGRVYVTATFNNTLITLTDLQGNTLAWSSSGEAGFKGARRATPFAAISAIEKVATKAKALGMGQAEVYIKGPGPGRDASIRALRGAGLNITMIADVTPVPYNGPRAKKKRRT
ncbi:30S ribosomal protein S11 [Candidatus Daviesbacteria bacterium RIFCSPLOWO2_02_FULL_40_8]|uniref:Small ribosomal subunit protein uS11 n=1 Tax=Candidatus Daviesbacteria bacterium RIFCSPLOWO2_01_FULL_40_24 TaxID=1797787 RepID=A0A1F5MJ42_9BACT|nr:MAG: 30S ribosomal protein S11 [Candidatus Daviesbacteria bacterium RIFCSPHIGHO2_01_FULL_41_45]OGE34942.1 MAG: 30S ribosomal protein S11 [Candidatus Daviesbacteria bacterium RIFCSPHIGHO2_02_FULL_41_14]OGE65349.1 MAG: 30S ribosomal protein S11 [Candidatus Daviesbacteria bacterium RIFCSPLOWO2_01_FULL_40_24]OGE65987.1 MAG: 30S ribosomal protein S11 [Candidatus Daviesbacteria bacterium RIFCSPLOWO2_02_FULL_40_8]